MNKLSVLVVEDEIIIADNICSTLQSLGYTVFEPVLNFSEAIKSIEKNRPDVAILDIHLSGKKTGIDLAKEINKKYNFPFIFLTANADITTVHKAKEVAPYAYLVKPFSKNELFTSIEIAVHNYSKKQKLIHLEKPRGSIFIKEKSILKKVYFDEIVFIKSAHIYIEINCKNGKKIITRTSLNDIKEKLNNSFIRIQRGYIANINYITEVGHNFIQVSDIRIPIGSKYKDNILQRMKLLQ